MGDDRTDKIIARVADLGMERVAEILRGIHDAELREIVARLSAHAIDVRFRVQAIDLQPFDAARESITAEDILKTLVPQFNDAFVRVGELIKAVNLLLPPPEEEAFDDDAFDMAFAEMDGALAPGEWQPPPDDLSLDFDNLLNDILVEQDSGDAKEVIIQRLRGITWQVSGLFKAELDQIRGRIGLEAVATNRWNLLGELHGTQHTLIKGTGAMVMGLCAAFAPVRKQELFPNYETELQSALELRKFVFLLRDTIRDLRERMEGTAEDQWRGFADAAFNYLEAYAFDTTLGQMRPLDKKTLIELRNRLFAALADEDILPRAFLEIMDDTKNFLEVLGVINNREMLVEHDHEALNVALLHLESAARVEPDKREASMRRALDAMAGATGRDRELDKIVEQAGSTPESVEPAIAIRHVNRVLTTLND